jgi:hypothetical protein
MVKNMVKKMRKKKSSFGPIKENLEWQVTKMPFKEKYTIIIL